MSSIPKMLFTVADKIYYEPLDRYRPQEHAFLEPVRGLLPSQWSITRERMWFYVAPNLSKLPVQGWKIHLSACPMDAVSLLLRIVPILVSEKVSFKFALDPLLLSIINGKGWSIGGIGKFVTVYPDTEQQFISLIAKLYDATTEFKGPEILSDRRYRDSKVIYYRYGGISARQVLSHKGEQVYVIATPDGRLTPDERQGRFVLPEWVKDPFKDEQSRADVRELRAVKSGRYTIDSTLSRSNTGAVYLGSDLTTGATVVIKEARPQLSYTETGEDAVALLKKEHNLLQKIAVAAVAPRPLDFFVEQEHAYLIQEHIPNASTLRAYASSRTIVLFTNPAPEKIDAFWSEYKTIIVELARILQTVHQHGIVLGDFSHNNVLIADGGKTVRIIDLEGAYEAGVQKPPNLVTPGFAAVGDLGSAPGFTTDYFALGAIMLAYIMPVNAMLLLDKKVHKRFLQSICDDFGLPQILERVIDDLLDAEPARRPAPAQVVSALQNSKPVKARSPERSEDLKWYCERLVEQIVAATLACATFDRQDRLFPCDPKLFVTNPLSISFGACGVAYAVKKINGQVPPAVLDWILSQPVNPKRYPPGLYMGLAGVAWVLSYLGVKNRGEEIIQSSCSHPALDECPDMFYGLAGWGIAQMKFFSDTGDSQYLENAIRAGRKLAATARQDSDKCCWPQSNGVIPIGFAHGASGISLFFLYLSLLSGDDSFLTLGKKALNYDIAAATTNMEGALTWQVRQIPGAPGVPYLRYGSAGVGLALVRYYRVLGEQRYLQLLKQLVPDVNRKYGIYPGRWIGLSGLGEFLLDARQLKECEDACSHALARVIEGIKLFQIATDSGVAFPGYELYRLSCDFGTGSAGVALLLHRYLRGGASDFLLDEVIENDKRTNAPRQYDWPVVNSGAAQN